MSDFLIDVILPKHEINLLAGPSGAGKTRWILNTLLDWQQGLPVLGFKSHPVPWVYVAADRTMASVTRTMEGMNIDPKSIPTIPAWDKAMGLHAILDEIKKSKAQLVLWESFGSFCEPPAQGHQVKTLINTVNRAGQQDNYTTIAVVESPKMKPFEKYENPRQRVSGAAAWAHFSETIFLVEPANVADITDNTRILNVCPRNAPGIQTALFFDHMGCLKPVPDENLDEIIATFKKRNSKKTPPPSVN